MFTLNVVLPTPPLPLLTASTVRMSTFSFWDTLGSRTT